MFAKQLRTKCLKNIKQHALHFEFMLVSYFFHLKLYIFNVGIVTWFSGFDSIKILQTLQYIYYQHFSNRIVKCYSQFDKYASITMNEHSKKNAHQWNTPSHTPNSIIILLHRKFTSLEFQQQEKNLHCLCVHDRKH